MNTSTEAMTPVQYNLFEARKTIERVIERLGAFRLQERAAAGESLTALEWEALNTLVDARSTLIFLDRP